MPPGDSSTRWRPPSSFSLSRATRLTPGIFVPLRPFLFVAKRTLLFCAAILISYVLITNMIGYERLWSNSATSTASGGAAGSVHRPEAWRNQRQDVEDARRTANGSVDRDFRAPPDELDANDLIVDQPEPRLQSNNHSVTRNTRRPVGTRLATEAKTGDVEDEPPDNSVNRRDDDQKGAQAIESILLNRTTAPAIEESHRQRLADTQRSPGVQPTTELPLCPMPPPDLIGKMKQSVLLMSMLKESDVIRSHPELSRGGHWKPEKCKARYKIAVIVPFRDRQSHLNRLIDFLIPMMERQLLDFRFIVTEQYGKDLFNKGRIMNAAFLLADKLGVDCVVFHDVDMFPQDDRNFYYCPDDPKHLGAYVNTLGYELWYDYIVGGVLAINMEHYRQINGYSNMYWAWGGEDDDMGYRIQANNLTILRPEKDYGTYTMLKHVKRQRTAPSMIYKLLGTAKTRWVTDGLNKVEWKVVKLIVKPLYFHLYVDVGTPPDEWRYEKPQKKKKK